MKSVDSFTEKQENCFDGVEEEGEKEIVNHQNQQSEKVEGTRLLFCVARIKSFIP